MTSISVCVLSLMLLLVTSLASLAQTTPGYTMHQITFPGAQTTWAYGGNDRTGAGGDVVGLYYLNGEVRSFVRWGATYLDFTLPDGDHHSLHAVTNTRVLIGNYHNPLGTIHGFAHIGASKEHTKAGLWSLEHIAVPGSRLTHLKGINEAGDVVGAYYLPGEERGRAFLLRDDTYYDIEATFGPPPGIEVLHIWAEDISGTSAIVGTVLDVNWQYSGWTLSNGVYQVFTVPGATETYALDLNDKGAVVGQYGTPDGWLRGFLYQGGRFTTINVTADAATSPQSIDNLGRIVGIFTRWHSDDFEDSTTIGFLAVPKPAKKSPKVAQR
jgi:hypothetical protein